jgi:hypothetical protein
MDTEQRNVREKGGVSTTDGHGTTAMRNPIDVSSLSSWMTSQPALSDLLSFINDDDDDDDDIDDERGGKRRRKLEDRLAIRQFGFGQSNPTYLLTITNDSDRRFPPLRLVLRRRPDKVAHPTSHDLHREYRVLVGLTTYNTRLSSPSSECESDVESSTSSGTSTDVFDGSIPVPRPYAYCPDASIVGSEFYVMEYVEGRIFVDPRMTTMGGPKERALAYRDAIRVLSVRSRIVSYVSSMTSPSRIFTCFLPVPFVGSSPDTKSIPI